ncbi:nucleotide exchange factor GrpE [Xylanibacter oryzae]|uniref:nucleotide exchange factor GrpE n=1 Tax=Xylanibacter oryzae TaxID=185293 RepID=UPI0004B3CBF0
MSKHRQNNMSKEEKIKKNVEDEKKVDTTNVEKNEVDNTEDTTAKDEDSQKEANSQENEQEIKDPLELANAKIDELKDKYLRAVAEFDNYRKRTIKEKAELILNGSERTISAVLPILDDMERALANSDKTEDPKVLKEGMDLIFQKFGKVLEGLGLKKIDTTDKDFDTDFHEAIAMVPGMGEDKKGKVLDCVQAGYTLNDKVIRHAKVAVGQ